MSIVTRFADAFNRQDVDALVDCFTADGSYDEFYNLVQEGTAWFSDPDQGGPVDNDIEAKFVDPVFAKTGCRQAAD